MPKSDIIRLQHMLDAAQKAVQFTEGRQRADLDSDDLLSLAVVRLIEVVGEAANKIEPETQGRYPNIPWSSIISARNRLIHGYDDSEIWYPTITAGCATAHGGKPCMPSNLRPQSRMG